MGASARMRIDDAGANSQMEGEVGAGLGRGNPGA